MTMVLVTHDREIAKRSDRILEIKDGKIVKTLSSHNSVPDTVENMATKYGSHNTINWTQGTSFIRLQFDITHF